MPKWNVDLHGCIMETRCFAIKSFYRSKCIHMSINRLYNSLFICHSGSHWKNHQFQMPSSTNSQAILSKYRNNSNSHLPCLTLDMQSHQSLPLTYEPEADLSASQTVVPFNKMMSDLTTISTPLSHYILSIKIKSALKILFSQITEVKMPQENHNVRRKLLKWWALIFGQWPLSISVHQVKKFSFFFGEVHP